MIGNKQLAVGALNKRLVVQEEQHIPDGCGGFERYWNTIEMVWAIIQPIRAVEEDQASNRNQLNTHRIFIRQGISIKQGMRLVLGNRVFEVRTVLDPDETGRYLECFTQESVLP